MITPITNFPRDVQELIFSYCHGNLIKLSAVCKSWRQHITNSTLLKNALIQRGIKPIAGKEQSQLKAYYVFFSKILKFDPPLKSLETAISSINNLLPARMLNVTSLDAALKQRLEINYVPTLVDSEIQMLLVAGAKPQDPISFLTELAPSTQTPLSRTFGKALIRGISSETVILLLKQNPRLRVTSLDLINGFQRGLSPDALLLMANAWKPLSSEVPPEKLYDYLEDGQATYDDACAVILKKWP